jgi:hypothetical protein
MRLTAHQPSYLPWLGYLAKIEEADLFVELAGVQYSKNDFTNRNRIRSGSGTIWLTVPVRPADSETRRIDSYEIIQDGWQRKHVSSLRHSYSKTPFFEKYFEQVADIIEVSGRASLAELNRALLTFALEVSEIKTPMIVASNDMLRGSKTELLVNLCKDFGATEFLFGGNGRDYADLDLMAKAGVEPLFQRFLDPEYRQNHAEFISRLGFVDALFNLGPEIGELVRSSAVLEGA